jgi:uncharacterized protein (TIGR02996 family)
VTEQHDGLLQAILDDPYDDDVRLVYADWLEDHDQAERAGFIRLQIELARLPKGDKRRKNMERREKALLAEHAQEWFSPPAGWQVRQPFHVRRGFPEVLHVEVADAIEHQDAIARWPIIRLRGRDLHTTSLDRVQLLAESPFLARIRELDLNYTPIGFEGLRILARSPHAVNLVRLEIGNNNIGDTGASLLARTSYMPGLRELDLCHNRITSVGLRALLRSKQRRAIRALSLSGNQVSPDDLCTLLESKNWPGLTDLNLWYTRLGNPGVRQLAGCRGLARLTALNLNNNNLTDAGIRALAGSPYASNLRTLHLSINTVSPKGADALIGSPHLQGLSRLYLDRSIHWKTGQRLAKHFGDRVSFDPQWG